jgi:hypothetical protein
MDMFERFSSNNEFLRYIWMSLRKFQLREIRGLSTNVDDVESTLDCAHSVMDGESCGDLAEEVARLDALPTVDTVRIDIIKDKRRGTETRRVICSLLRRGA